MLANEQVIDGRGWRSGALVEQRELTQWFLKITAYAEDLLQSLDQLKRWPEKVRLMQENWIGRSEGLLLRFELEPTLSLRESEIEVYTTRPGYAVWRALRRARPRSSAGAGLRRGRIRRSPPSSPNASGKAPRKRRSRQPRRSGYDTGLKVRHPFDETWLLPVYVANFVLMDYGTGAMFGCPAHDQRDLDFANAYGLGNTPVSVRRASIPTSFVIIGRSPMTATAC